MWHVKHRDRPLRIGSGPACLVVTASLFALMLGLGRAEAGPVITAIPFPPGDQGVTTDAFDVHQGATVLANSAMAGSFLGSGPSIPESTLGAISTFAEPPNTIFADSPPPSGFDFIRFVLPAQIDLGSFNFYLGNDGAGTTARAITSFDLRVSSDGIHFSSISSGTVDPDYVAAYGSAEIRVSDNFNGVPIGGVQYVEIDVNRTAANSGPRLLELDGFAVPEPASLALLAVGTAWIGLRTRCRRQGRQSDCARSLNRIRRLVLFALWQREQCAAAV